MNFLSNILVTEKGKGAALPDIRSPPALVVTRNYFYHQCNNLLPFNLNIHLVQTIKFMDSNLFVCDLVLELTTRMTAACDLIHF